MFVYLLFICKLECQNMELIFGNIDFWIQHTLIALKIQVAKLYSKTPLEPLSRHLIRLYFQSIPISQPYD